MPADTGSLQLCNTGGGGWGKKQGDPLGGDPTRAYITQELGERISFPAYLSIRPWGLLGRLRASWVHWRDPLVREKVMRVRVNGEFVFPTEPPPLTNVERMVLSFLQACVATMEEPSQLITPLPGEVEV